MPRYYCDYCDTYLTHDSPSVRKQHNAGYKHKANIRAYYQKFEEHQTQILIDQRIKEHLGQTAVYQQIGVAYNQHLVAYPGGRPHLPVMPPPPVLPLPGGVPPHLAPGSRPPVLPIPIPGAPGYRPTPTMPMQPPPVSSLPMHPNTGHPNASATSPVPGGGPPPTISSGMPPVATQMYHVNLIGAAATGMETSGSFSHPQIS